jgi:DNA (cytosine-5)-methyltransferase 1
MEEQALDQAPIWSDLVTFDTGPWRGRVDIVTAGFPCQPFSAAGQRRGVDDDRWLWPDIARIIGDVGPRYVFLENVPGLVRGGLPHVVADLASLGFDAEWGLLSAAAVGAPHRRQRFWLLADTASDADKPPIGGPGTRSVASRTGRELADADHARHAPSRYPAQPGRDTRNGIAAGGGHVGHTDGPRRPSENVADPGSIRRGEGFRPDGLEYAAPRFTDAATTRRRRFPPPPADIDGWAEWITAGGPEPQVRRGPDGRPLELADALHAGGNGLVPRVAAAALLLLAERLGSDLT